MHAHQKSKGSSSETRTTRTPAFWGYPHCLMITHTIESDWIPSQKRTKSKFQIQRICQNFKFFNFEKKINYTRHTFWSCLIRCANIKWIRRVLLKIQSGHDSSTDGQTDVFGEFDLSCHEASCSAYLRTDGRTRWNQYTLLSTSLKRGV